MTDQSVGVFNPDINNAHIKYLHLLLEANERTNLTAIKEFSEAYIKHLQDSLAICLWEKWKDAKKGIDLGSGGGLPGIPLAISFPDKQFYLLESNTKKVNFLREVVQELKLRNVEVIHGRAEEYGQKEEWRETMDFVVSRAVSSLSVLLELSVAFLKIKGSLIAYKGPNISDEMNHIKNALKALNSSDQEVISYELPLQAGNRCMIVFEKWGSTPKIYPRRPGMPEKRPL